jgi:hypothetical protein
VEEAKATGCINEERRRRLWAEVRDLRSEDLEWKQRISELLYPVIEANRSRKAKYGNVKPEK